MNGRPVKIYEGGKMFVNEITLPADGETIEYDPPLLLFENDAAKLVVSSASRDGKKLTFYSTKTDKCFDSLSMDICTSEREVFAGLHAEEKEDGKLEYVTYLYERVDDYDSRIKSYQVWLREDGKQYDGSKDWYSVSTGRLFEN